MATNEIDSDLAPPPTWDHAAHHAWGERATALARQWQPIIEATGPLSAGGHTYEVREVVTGTARTTWRVTVLCRDGRELWPVAPPDAYFEYVLRSNDIARRGFVADLPALTDAAISALRQRMAEARSRAPQLETMRRWTGVAVETVSPDAATAAGTALLGAAGQSPGDARAALGRAAALVRRHQAAETEIVSLAADKLAAIARRPSITVGGQRFSVAREHGLEAELVAGGRLHHRRSLSQFGHHDAADASTRATFINHFGEVLSAFHVTAQPEVSL